jgi:hypothetical protein
VKTRRLTEPWPFLYSVVGGRAVRNLPPKPVKVPAPKIARLKRGKRESASWVQEGLFGSPA